MGAPDVRDIGKMAGVVLAFVLLSALLLTWSGIEYALKPPENGAYKPELPSPSIGNPVVERLRNPTVILVLDVSGSMKNSDPDHMQAAAVMRFYDTYSKLAREVLEQGETPTIAIVLFSTVAQVIDWTGSKGAFLDVNEKNRDVFRRVIDEYLGTDDSRSGPPRRNIRTDNDPRTGSDTDYAAALDAVDRLLSTRQASASSPPAVVFMTDGINDPHPYFSPVIPVDKRESLPGYAASGLQKRRLAEALGFLTPGNPTFNRKSMGIKDVAMPSWADVDDQVKQRVSRILTRRYSMNTEATNAPPLWVPVFLNKTAERSTTRKVAKLLGADEANLRFWSKPHPLIHCHTADELVREYVAVLARWFRLVELPLAKGTREFNVPKLTQAFAVLVHTKDRVSGVTLAKSGSDGRKVPLNGAGGFWGTVVSGNCEGRWTIDAESGLKDVSVFVRPRYDWSIAIPPKGVVGDKIPSPTVALYLCRIDGSRCDHGKTVYGSIPPDLPASLHLEGIGQERGFVLKEAGSNIAGKSPTYIGEVPVRPGDSGKATVTVDASVLKKANIPIGRVELVGSFKMVHFMTLVVRDSEGKETTIGVDNLPRLPTWLEPIKGFIDSFREVVGLGG